MIAPFISNYQFNYIRNQVKHLQNSKKTAADPKVIDAVQLTVHQNITQLFGGLQTDQQQLLERISEATTVEQLEQYIVMIAEYRLAFSELTPKQLQKLFAKVKKLKLPNLTEIDWKKTTYLGWSDIGQNKMYIVYEWHNDIVGIEGRITPSQKGVCCLCNKHSQLGLFTAITKQRPANASPDYYKAYGNYICLDSVSCNENITDTTAIERLLGEIVGTKK